MLTFLLLRKLNKIFLLKLLYENSGDKFDEFLRQNESFIFPLKEAPKKRKCLFYFILCVNH